MCKEPVQSCVLKGPLDTFPETPAPRAARLVDTNYQPNWTCASPKSSSIYTCCVYIHTRTCIRRHPARRFESVAIMPKLIYIYTHMYRQSNTPTISQPLVNTTKYTHTNTYQYTHTQTRTNTYKYIQIIQIHTKPYEKHTKHTNTYKHIHAYTNIQIYMPTYLRTYIFTHVIVIIHV